MSEHKSLLVELGCEELPPKALDALSAAFADGICKGLQERGFDADTGAARAFSTPRRMAVHVPAVADRQPEQAIERRGPAVESGLDDKGNPGKALLGFARSCGVEVDTLERVRTDKGEWFVYRAVQPGKVLADLLPEMIDSAIKSIPVPRPMRWGDHDYSFVRPVHWLLVLHGDQVIDANIMGLVSGRQSHGHRFHHPEPVHVADADSWQEALRGAHVLVDPAERRQLIEQRCAAMADEKGLVLSPMDPTGLMQELVNITEWPTPVLCRFGDDFLSLPGEVLRTTMEVDQRFIATAQQQGGKLSPWFFGIANIESKDPQQIRQGYERVIRPRFADARFFYDEDMKTPLADYQQQLQQVTYQKSLGSIWDKCTRVAELARITANRVGVDGGLVTHAAALSKCDLVTRMVGEFPGLQGVMGRYYAREQGEMPEIASALDEFYLPRHSGDRIANTPLSRVLAVAERMDTLAGIFAVGMKPTGNKDPFALRRAALGLARTLIEGDMAIDLRATFVEALELIPESALEAGVKKKSKSKEDVATSFDAGKRRAKLTGELYTFVLDRLRGYYADQGFEASFYEAVLAVAPASLPDFDRRLRAVAEFARLPEAASLAAANKRVGNILRKQDEVPQAAPAVVDDALFEDEAERTLAAAIAERGRVSDEHCATGDYTAALQALAGLQQPIDHFFDQVMVMADDPVLRKNRLALLADLQARFMAIADIACLHV